MAHLDLRLPGPMRSRHISHLPRSRRPLHILTASLALLATACGGDSSVDPVEVRNLTLTVEPTKLFLAEGQDGRLHATLVDDAGRTVPTRDLTWASSDPSIATVDGTGVVTGVAAGTVLVTASANGKKSGSNVKVRGKGRLELQRESGSGQTGPVGEMLPQPLVVKVQDQSGAGVPGIEVDWKANGGDGSTSASSTTTNQNGLTQVVWTLGPSLGSQSVQAQIKGSGGVEFHASATVGSPASVTLSPGSASLEVGAEQRFTASAQDRYGNPVADASFTWTSTAADIVDVDGKGMAKAMSPGTARVEASAGPASGGADVEVTGETGPALPGTVTDLAVRSVTASAATLGFTQVGDGSGSPADYEVRFAESPMEYRWDSAVPVSAGSCTAPVEGTGIGESLTCSVEGLAEATAYDFVVVARNGSTTGELSNVATGTTASAQGSDVASVTASPEAHVFTALAQSLQLSATAYDAAGTPVPEAGLGWSSSDTLTATVDDMGLVVARAVGTVSIVVSALCCSAADTVAIDVTQVPAYLDVVPAVFSLGVDQTQQLTATVLDAGSHVIEGIDVEWSSSDPGVASVDLAGLVTGLAPGSAVIQARAGEAVSTASGNVYAPVAPEQVTDLTHIGDGVLSWTQVGDGAGSPAHYAIRHGCPTISWGTAYGTEVSVAGTAVGAPMEYATGQTDGSCEYQLVAYRGTLNVDAVFGSLSNVATASLDGTSSAPASIEVTPASFTLKIGETRQLTATVLDANGNVLPDVGVEWSSTAPAVASIGSTGLVTGLATGTAQFQARLSSTTISALSSTVASLGTTGTWSTANSSIFPTAASTSEPVGVSSATVQDFGWGTDPHFQDTFESGDLSGGSGGFSWSSPNRTDVRNMLDDVGVRAHSGDNALRFRYPAALDGADSFAEQRFQLGGSYSEVWFEYWLYVPDNFFHRDQSGAENNKFMQIYDGDVSGSKQFHLTLEFERNDDGTSRFKRFLSRSRGLFPPPTSTALDQQDYWPDPSYDSQEINWLPTDFISKPGGLDYSGRYIRIGEWNRIRVHFRSASCYECFDGYASVHVNGNLAKELTWNFWGQDSYENPKEARATAGYLMGWANSGYSEETKFWIDDFKVWTADPGWE